MLNVFSPYLEPGKLIPVQPLEKDDFPVFKAVLEAVDLSPNLTAAFLPPSIAGSLTPLNPQSNFSELKRENHPIKF